VRLHVQSDYTCKATRVLAPALKLLRVAHCPDPGLSNCLFSDDVADAKLIKAFLLVETTAFTCRSTQALHNTPALKRLTSQSLRASSPISERTMRV
jgi:hypothetical protein